MIPAESRYAMSHFLPISTYQVSSARLRCRELKNDLVFHTFDAFPRYMRPEKNYDLHINGWADADEDASFLKSFSKGGGERGMRREQATKLPQLLKFERSLKSLLVRQRRMRSQTFIWKLLCYSCR